MKVTEIFNKTKDKKKVVVCEEKFASGTEYWVCVYELDKRGETLVSNTPFKSKIASLKYAEMEL